ncbi:MAG: mannose-1-phosphate guanylyltransferase [Ruminococcus sp.]|nr:mannose-1-phosphate guanylyltransferase [Ruminococcus sp.]
MKITAVIMAGGRGERFWPKSRNSRPKQFLSLTSDGKTMIQKTVERISSLVDAGDIYIVTNAAYKGFCREQLPDIPEENILAEPAPRNTAPCIALAAAVIGRKYDDAVMLVLPSDQLIRCRGIFINTLKKAVKAAENSDDLITIGITPSYPETGYGYICCGSEKGDVFEVEAFREKPDLPTAKKYLASGNYLWNSGMFIWRLATINASLKRLMPEIYEGAQRIGAAFGSPDSDEVLEREFTAFPSESVDFGIMEKSENICTIPGSFGWDDVGSWLSVERINDTDSDRNCISGDVITENVRRTTICGGKRLIAAVGVKDVIIVDTDDALLVCAKDSTQDVKQIIAKLRENGRDNLI